MTNLNTAAAGPSDTGMRSEIIGKWSRFSVEEVKGLADNAALVAKVASKYSIDAAQAQRDVDAFAKGRQL